MIFKKMFFRFARTISAQFTGHTHTDEFNLYFASNNPDIALNVAWNGGSVTSFIDVNPNYSVYDVDGGSFEVLDIYTWIYNLTDANSFGGTPQWYLEYSFRQDFGVDMSPASLKDLVQLFTEDKELLKKYWSYKFKMADPFLKRDCNNKCLRWHLCEIVVNESFEHPFCKAEFELTFEQHDIQEL